MRRKGVTVMINEIRKTIDDTVKKIKKDIVPAIKNDYYPKFKANLDMAYDKTMETVDGLAENAARNATFSASDLTRDEFMLKGRFASNGYDWWWHSFTGHDRETGEEKSFFIEYFTVNPALGEDEPVLGQDPENQEMGKKPSYVMVKCGAWGPGAKQLHRYFSWNEVKITPNAPFSLEAEDCYCSEGRIAGSVNISEEDAKLHPEWMCDAGSMKWNLSVDKKIAFNVGYGASKPVRMSEAFEMFWHAEGMKTEYTGMIEYDGREYVVRAEDSFGYADKNWGSDFTSPWVWLSSNNLTSKKTGKRLMNSVFDIGGGSPGIGGFEIRDKLLGAMFYEGTEMEFNFTKVWTDPKTRFDCKETDTDVIWHIELQNAAYVMLVNAKCSKSDMLLINYEAPDGIKLHNRLWNGGNGEGIIKLYRKNGSEKELIDEIYAKNIGCEWGEYDI